MAIQSRRISNTRPQKSGTNQVQFATLTTNGSMAISRSAMFLLGLKIDDAALIEAFDANAVGLPPTFDNTTDVHLFTKGYYTSEKGDKTVGSRISDTNGKNVISLATLYKELNGNNLERNNFSFSDPIFGFLEMANGKVVPITKDSPEDEGTVSAYVRSERTTENGKTIVNVELEETSWTVAECKELGQPIFALQFESSTPKVVRAVKGEGVKAGKAGKSSKSTAVVNQEDADEFDEA